MAKTKRKRKGGEPQFATIEELIAYRAEQGRINNAKRRTRGGPRKKSAAESELDNLIRKEKKKK